MGDVNLNTDSLEKIIKKSFRNVSRKVIFNPLNKGTSHKSWIFDIENNKFLIKFQEKKEKVDKRFKILSLLKNNNILCPSIIAKGFDKNLNLYFTIENFVGTNDAEGLLDKLSRKDQIAFANDIGVYLKQLHKITPEDGEFRLGIFNGKPINWIDYLNLIITKARKNQIHDSIIKKTLIKAAIYSSEIIKILNFDDIKPGFTHRDIYNPNIIIKNNRFHCLIDFEYSKFYHPIWDFVKLFDIVFNNDNKLIDEFLISYSFKNTDHHIDMLNIYKILYYMEGTMRWYNLEPKVIYEYFMKNLLLISERI